MDRVITYQLTKWSEGVLNHHWSKFLPLGRQRDENEKSNFLSILTSCSFHKYLTWQYRNEGVPKSKPGRPLLDYVVHPQPQVKGHRGNSLTVKCLLENGADPNELVAGQTMYYRLLVLAYRHRNENLQTKWSRELKSIVALFRSHGAQLWSDQLDALQNERDIILSKADLEYLISVPPA